MLRKRTYFNGCCEVYEMKLMRQGESSYVSSWRHGLWLVGCVPRSPSASEIQTPPVKMTVLQRTEFTEDQKTQIQQSIFPDESNVPRKAPPPAPGLVGVIKLCSTHPPRSHPSGSPVCRRNTRSVRTFGQYLQTRRWQRLDMQIFNQI